MNRSAFTNKKQSYRRIAWVNRSIVHMLGNYPCSLWTFANPWSLAGEIWGKEGHLFKYYVLFIFSVEQTITLTFDCFKCIYFKQLALQRPKKLKAESKFGLQNLFPSINFEWKQFWLNWGIINIPQEFFGSWPPVS